MSIDAGLVAVRMKFGSHIEQRMRMWPRIAEQYASAWYDDPELIRREVAAAKKALERACKDPDFALDQAGAIARAGVSYDDIPSASLIRKQMAEADEEASKNLRTFGEWYRKNGNQIR